MASEFPKPKSSSPERLGRENGVLFTGFVFWILEECRRNQIKTIYYFTREGVFFRKLHEAVCRCMPEIGNPASALLEVSRMSTFLPSLETCGEAEWLRLWRQYPEQTLADFFRTLHVPAEEGLSLAEKYGMDKSDIVFRSEKMRRLIIDPAFQEFVNRCRGNSRELLLQYCRQRGITDETRRIAVVDIGWRGTIQDNLCRLFPRCEIDGYYLGLVPFLNPQPANAVKQGYINLSRQSGALLKSVTPLEFLTTSSTGSVCGYRRLPGGAVEAEVLHLPAEDQKFEEYTAEFQKAVLAQTETLCQQAGAEREGNLREEGFRALYRLMARPDLQMARSFFSLVYNENFGLGRSLNRNRALQPEIFLRAPLGRRNLGRLREFLNETSWPQGYLKIHHLGWLIPFYNGILKRMPARDI